MQQPDGPQIKPSTCEVNARNGGLMASRQGALALLFPGPLKQQLSWGVCSI